MRAIVYSSVYYSCQRLVSKLHELLDLEAPPEAVSSVEQLHALAVQPAYSLLVCHANKTDALWKRHLAEAYRLNENITLILIGDSDDLLYALGEPYSKRLHFMEKADDIRVLKSTLMRIPDLVPFLRSPEQKDLCIQVEAGALRKILLERYWQDILILRIPEPGRIMPELFPTDGSPGTLQILPVLFPIKQWPENCTNRDRLNAYADLKRILTAMLFPVQGPYDIILELGSEMLTAIAVAPQGQTPLYGDIIARCDHFLSLAKAAFGCDLICYVGEWDSSVRLFDQFDALLHLDDQNVYPAQAITQLSDRREHPPVPELPDMQRWVDLLIDRSFAQVQAEMNAFLQTLKGSAVVDSGLLYGFQQDFAQSFAIVLQAYSLPAHKLLGNRQYVQLMHDAVKSMDNIEKWVTWCISSLHDLASKSEESLSTVEQVRQYITQNLSSTLSCEAIAANVFLSPSYLSRLFKQETGNTLKHYIMELRLRRAEELLSTTSRSITEIAIEVGYTSYSYFASTFHRATGFTPSEYRLRYSFASAEKPSIVPI